jgi:hypothetical protein
MEPSSRRPPLGPMDRLTSDTKCMNIDAGAHPDAIGIELWHFRPSESLSRCPAAPHLIRSGSPRILWNSPTHPLAVLSISWWFPRVRASPSTPLGRSRTDLCSSLVSTGASRISVGPHLACCNQLQSNPAAGHQLQVASSKLQLIKPQLTSSARQLQVTSAAHRPPAHRQTLSMDRRVSDTKSMKRWTPAPIPTTICMKPSTPSNHH